MWHSASRLFAIAVFVVAATTLTEAQPQGQRSDQQLVILSAVTNRASETLTIRGMNFGAVAPLVFSEQNAMTVLSATATEIVVALPANVPDGTYLLTVMRGRGAVDRDSFHFTTQAASQGLSGPAGADGAMGPQGATGAQGPAGPQGPAGVMGPMGLMGPIGPAGPQGPAGAGGIGPLEIVSALNSTAMVNVPGGSSITVDVACPADKQAISGGFQALAFAVNMVPVASYPLNATTWRVMLRNQGATQINMVQVRAYVVCAPVG